jgi:chromosome segregation ATPase
MRRELLAATIGSIVLVGSGCATQDALRQTETQSAEQSRAVQLLRIESGRNDAMLGELRKEIRRLQETVRGLEVGLAENRTRADAARTQADGAVSISRDFLKSLVEAREEQRRQLAENGTAFADVDRRLGELSARLQAQQRLLEQTAAATADAARRLAAVETGLAEAGKKSAALEARENSGRQADESLTRELATLRAQVEETRSVINSRGLIDLMRQVEGVRRETAVLRGSIEEMQQGQSEAAGRTRNFYTDLDARIQALKRELSQHAAQAGSRPDDAAPAVAPPSEPPPRPSQQ